MTAQKSASEKLLSDLKQDFEKNFLVNKNTDLVLAYDSMINLAYCDELHSDYIAHEQPERFRYAVTVFKRSMSKLTGAELNEKIIRALKESAEKIKSEFFLSFIIELKN